MTDKIIKDYFDGTVAADKLVEIIPGAIKDVGGSLTWVLDKNESSQTYLLTSKHIIKLCLDALNQKIKLSDLRAIALLIRGSDLFHWDSDTGDGKKVDDVICNWESPEINTPTTMDYVQYCAYYLETGEHR
ncbi:MAG: hypothetical protein U0Y96_00330 [Candidatus Kapaibacterium sp.]|nr:hypothetical protein [Bacteroidota bacterium]